MSSFFHIVLTCNVFRAYLDIFGTTIFSFSQKVASSLCPVFVLSYLAVGDSYQCSHLTSQQESKQAYFTNVTIYSNALLLVHLCVYTYTCPPRCVTDFFYLMGVFGISVHAKGLGKRGGSLLHSKGRKATWSFLCLLQWQNGLARRQTFFLWGAEPKVMGQLERGSGTRPTSTLFIYFLSHSSPPLCFPAWPLCNINMQAHELVACYVYDLRL